MGLEAATYISELNAANPTSGDQVKQGDDHLRLLKAVLQATFPGANRAWRFPGAAVTGGSGAIAASEESKLFLVQNTAAVTLTLPATAGLPVGWLIDIMKSSGDDFPVFVQAASGNIFSGSISYAKIRIHAVNEVSRFIWDGSAWRRPLPMGVHPAIPVPFLGASIPTGWAALNGQTLSGADADYPELMAWYGSRTLPNYCGKVVAGLDNMGLGANGILTGATLHAILGAQSIVLTEANLPPHAHTFSGTTSTDGAHTHEVPSAPAATGPGRAERSAAGQDSTVVTTSNGAHSHSYSGTTSSIGSGAAHSLVQPTICANWIVRKC